jgi:hypothetical protein
MNTNATSRAANPSPHRCTLQYVRYSDENGSRVRVFFLYKVAVVIAFKRKGFTYGVHESKKAFAVYPGRLCRHIIIIVVTLCSKQPFFQGRFSQTILLWGEHVALRFPKIVEW